MVRILGISGSLRAGSFNTALLRVAQELAVPGIELELATLHGIPLYDGDLEQREGLPQAVVALKERVLASDGLLLATPEYNNGIPACSRTRSTGCRVRPPAFPKCSVAARWH